MSDESRTESEHPQYAVAPATPIAGQERFVSLDMLRGVAVLGILVMNIYAFAMPFQAYTNPLVWGGVDSLNMGTWFVTHVLADQKFMTIFSLLFGAGIVMMADRAAARGASFGSIFFRRQFWLLVIGALHGYFIWFGDILFFYAVVGMLAWLFRKRTARTLIITGCCLLPISVVLAFGGGQYMAKLQGQADTYEAAVAAGESLTDEQQQTVEEWAEARPMIAPGPEEIQSELDAYRGSYADAMSHRVPFVAGFQVQGLLFFILWRVGGLMLIGMALMKLGIVTGERDTAFYKKMLWLGYGIGLPLTVFSALNAQAHAFDPLYMFSIGNIPNYVGSIVVAFGHIALVMLIAKSGAWAGLMRRFASVGRMALSNYLMHSVVMTLVFYGYGLGYFGSVPRFWQVVMAVGLIAVQLMISPWWLARFRFGPAEWLWRSLSYWRRQPMRR